MRGLFFLVLLLATPTARAQEIRVRPYVQDATPTSAWILWETTDGEESRVEWGATEALGEVATGAAIASEGAARIHEVRLTGLAPATRYHYRAHTGAAVSAIAHFTTPPALEAETSFRMIAVSDMQRDAARPDVYRDLVHRGILAYSAREWAAEPDDAIAFVLVPGDLVEDGRVHGSWRDEFFEPGADLMAFVPFYPVLGNHERATEHYFRYFHLPDHGGDEGRERWWAMDHGNVRVIGLDSNLVLLTGAQQGFFEEQLGDACVTDRIDFVVVQIHHAHRSELWPTGEEYFATQVVERMDRFSTDCDRPTVQLYGHTHGYSRGASRDHAHLWIDVASAGGNLDRWGEDPEQYDVDEVSVSQDEHGFVVLEITAGDDPSMRLRRIGVGGEDDPRDPEVRDEIVVRRWNEPPAPPAPLAPRGRVAPSCDVLRADPFADPDGDLQGATHWQIAAACDGFDAPVLERYRQHENWYGGVDTQAGDDLADEPIAGGELEPGVVYCWRARYRDRSLGWSEWSEPVAFTWDDAGDPDCDDPEPLAPPPPAASCGCATGARSSSPAWLALLALLALRRWRRPVLMRSAG